jgi:dolichyl-phosphate-mannose-protein mannosyltransferase
MEFTFLKAIRSFFVKFYKWEHFWLCMLVVATLILHFVIVDKPPSLILDEQYYINEARDIIDDHVPKFQEHPPLGKLFIVTGIKLFGDNTLGWRFFSIVLGTACIVLFYFICRRLNLSPPATNIATFLLALENMTFIQASVAMLDVFFLVFMLAAFLLYLNRRYIATGISAGFGVLAKLTGALAMPALIIHWFFTRESRSRLFALSLVLSVVTFVGLLPLFDYFIVQNFSSVASPLERIKTMLDLTGSITFETSTHGSMARPWEWLITYKPMPFWWTPHYLAAISPTVWALTIPSFGYMVFKAIRKNEAGLFGAAWFASTYLLWIPASLITDRISYVFYFYPSIGAVCIGLGIGLSDLLGVFRKRPSGKLKWTLLAIVVLFLLAHIVAFMLLYPLFPIKYY